MGSGYAPCPVKLLMNRVVELGGEEIDLWDIKAEIQPTAENPPWPSTASHALISAHRLPMGFRLLCAPKPEAG